MNINERLRTLPKVDELLMLPSLFDAAERFGRPVVLAAARTALDDLRLALLSEQDADTSPAGVASAVLRLLEEASKPSLRPVLNATGVVLHTNLGRAVLSEAAALAAAGAARDYSTLEYNLARGGRGERSDHVESLICKITGCEAALVVNNNAAAVLISLGEIARGQAVAVSRGELVEIGGAFRVPEIMEQSGCLLREVGTTNKTRLSDYERAARDGLGALLKVHTSNYRIVGFTEEVPLEELCQLGKRYDLPVIYDLGSGLMLPLEPYGIVGEPTVPASIRAGADIVTFSTDKLLGGPQGGIVAGKAELVGRIHRHPLYRAFRPDKLTLAALEATLRTYLDPERALSEIPTLRMLTEAPAVIQARAWQLSEALEARGIFAEVLPDVGQVGGGSAPTQEISTHTVALSEGAGAIQLEQKLRTGDPPIIARIARDRLLLDARTITDDQVAVIASRLAEILHG